MLLRTTTQRTPTQAQVSAVKADQVKFERVLNVTFTYRTVFWNAETLKQVDVKPVIVVTELTDLRSGVT